MSDDGRHLSGSSRGLPIAADRKGADEAPPAPSIFDPILF
jgi:hypothetical protein